jgi:hypothetical protein
MNFNHLIDALCALAMANGLSVGGYKAYHFVQHEVNKQQQRGLSSLEKFSHALT